MKLDATQLQDLLGAQFPGAHRTFTIEAADEGRVRVRMHFTEGMLRPGDAISGPAMMSLADTAMYMAVLAHLGPVVAVTSDLHIRFLRRAPPGDLAADCEILKIGRRIATGLVRVYDVEGVLVAHVSCSYALSQS